MQVPVFLELEIFQHHIKETFVETLTDIIGISLTHNARCYAGWGLQTSISDTVNTIEIANSTLIHVTI